VSSISAQASLSPFEQLQALERRCRANAAGLPAQEEVKEEWTGVLFRLKGQDLLAPMTEVAEIVSLPEVARVPGVKPWVLGIANMRGNLLPVLDLQAFLYGEPSKADAKIRRLLVVNRGGVFAGLLVDAVMGMKHFWTDEELESSPRLDGKIDPFIVTGYRRLGEQYPVFSMSRLIESEAFLHVAV
jgi:twitching motility protein PilI